MWFRGRWQIPISVETPLRIIRQIPNFSWTLFLTSSSSLANHRPTIFLTFIQVMWRASVHIMVQNMWNFRSAASRIIQHFLPIFAMFRSFNPLRSLVFESQALELLGQVRARPLKVVREVVRVSTLYLHTGIVLPIPAFWSLISAPFGVLGATVIRYAVLLLEGRVASIVSDVYTAFYDGVDEQVLTFSEGLLRRIGLFWVSLGWFYVVDDVRWQLNLAFMVFFVVFFRLRFGALVFPS
jgi:hypothetical protein